MDGDAVGVDVEKICWQTKHVCQSDHNKTPDERVPCCEHCQASIDAIRRLGYSTQLE